MSFHPYHCHAACHFESNRPQEIEEGISNEKKWEMMRLDQEIEIIDKLCASLSHSLGCDWGINESVT